MWRGRGRWAFVKKIEMFKGKVLRAQTCFSGLSNPNKYTQQEIGFVNSLKWSYWRYLNVKILTLASISWICCYKLSRMISQACSRQMLSISISMFSKIRQKVSFGLFLHQWMSRKETKAFGRLILKDNKNFFINSTILHCKQDPIYVFLEMKLRGLVPISTFISSHDRATYFAADRSWEQNRRTDRGNIYKSLTDSWMYELGTTLLSFISGNICFEFSVVSLQCVNF